MLLIILMGAALSPLPRQWAQFNRTGALSRVSETVEVTTDFRGDRGHYRYKLRFTKTAPKTAAVVQWADSAKCAAVATVIASMREIPSPTFSPYGVPDRPFITVADGTSYSLSGPSTFTMGELTMSSNVGSPLADWINGAFDQLASCWTLQDD